jgi:nucleoside-diphosphate-sugar epimerase
MKEMPDPVVILGLGFTTRRLAQKLKARDVPVYAAMRGARAADFPANAVLIHSVPPREEPEKSAVRAFIRELAPRRILYISSTGVYGSQSQVSEETIAAPDEAKGYARLEEEQWLLSLGIPLLILRSSAIYGPGRGVHVRLRQEEAAPRGAGGVVSRVHVDDLAALLDAGIDSQLAGAWPVADDHPAASEDVVNWCANYMGLELPDISRVGKPISGRTVDGRKIRELLGVEFRYPSYRTGIPACILEEDQ